jgi:hypothetical protein
MKTDLAEKSTAEAATARYPNLSLRRSTGADMDIFPFHPDQQQKARSVGSGLGI